MSASAKNARPSSASSREAWGDYGGHARPDSQFDFGQEAIRNDPDLAPSAMEDDTEYNSNDRSKANGKGSAVATTGSKKKSNQSCFGKIGSGIRSLWATRQTEDVKGDRELHVKTTLRELIIYLAFLIILCIVTFGMTGTTMYYYTKVMSDLFLDTTVTSGGSFRTITSVEDFWKFAKEPMLKGLYWETWYNNMSVPDEQLGYIYYENKLLGVPRLRQLQVHSNSCVVHDDFKDVIRECYESYSESLENKEAFGEKDNYTAWYYRSEDELDGSSYWGQITTYSGAGYVQDLTRNKSESEAIINYLFDKRWVRRGTRVLFIDFTVYNANINLFCVVQLTVEFPPTGGAIPHYTLRTVKLIRYVTAYDYFIMACEFILCLFILYYMVEEAIEIKKHKCAYFKSVWNILDILVIVIMLLCVGFNVYRTIKVGDLLKDLLDKPDQYADFVFLSYGQVQFDNAIAIAVFLAWIKIFKYISFNKTMTQLSSTLGKCAKDLAGFAVMFFIIFLAFTQLGYLLFGTQVKDFSNFKQSFFTLFRIILGDFDFDQLEAANRVLGPIFFMLFVFFVFFVLINMFLAIINDTYSEVKGDMANQKNEFEMTDYFKRGYEKMLSKLNFKHEKIVDIQKALQTADINNDKQVDFDEWRQDLKTRGYADGEIEALFAKYDIDGDRVLDEEEQRKMLSDLNDQKAALNKEYDDLDKMQRPESARRSTSRVSFNDDSGDDSDDEDSHTKSSRSGNKGPSQGVQYEEFTVLSRRVDRMEHSIGSIVSKIDAVLVKLEAMEKAKLKRRETMGKILDSITESDGTSDEVKREQMERLVREELERWDSESSITPQPSGRGASPSSSGRGGGARSRAGANATLSEKLPEKIVEAPERIIEVREPYEKSSVLELSKVAASSNTHSAESGFKVLNEQSLNVQHSVETPVGSNPDIQHTSSLFRQSTCVSEENTVDRPFSPSSLSLDNRSKHYQSSIAQYTPEQRPETAPGGDLVGYSARKDLRATTPILPGIPSNTYSVCSDSTELSPSITFSPLYEEEFKYNDNTMIETGRDRTYSEKSNKEVQLNASTNPKENHSKKTALAPVITPKGQKITMGTLSKQVKSSKLPALNTPVPKKPSSFQIKAPAHAELSVDSKYSVISTGSSIASDPASDLFSERIRHLNSFDRTRPCLILRKQIVEKLDIKLGLYGNTNKDTESHKTVLLAIQSPKSESGSINCSFLPSVQGPNSETGSINSSILPSIQSPNSEYGSINGCQGDGKNVRVQELVLGDTSSAGSTMQDPTVFV